MKEEVKLEPSKELAYWVGVAQSDGCFYKYHEYGRTKPRFLISLEVRENSIPMLKKFTELSKSLLKRSSTIWKSKRGSLSTHIRVTSLVKTFQGLDIHFRDPPTPPIWVMEESKYFGPYLAGLIDGDGSVTIRRPQYPQCFVRIWSGSPQVKLSKIIRERLRCGASVTKQSKKSYLEGRLIKGTVYALEFLVSSRTWKFFQDFILPYVQLDYKKETIETYISSRWSNN